MDGHVGAHVPLLGARAQVGDGHDTPGDEAAQRDDRHGHVDVEDLLDEPLVGVVGRVEEDEREGGRQHDGGGERQGAQPLAVHVWTQSSNKKSNTA